MASGTVSGSSVTWELDDTGVLTLGGTGSMPNGSALTSPPWTKSKVKKLIVKDGVTVIGNFWFRGTTSLTEIEISDTVTHIGTSNNANVNYGVFAGCTSLRKVIFGKGVTTITRAAFYECSALREIYFMGGQPTFTGYSAGNLGTLYNQFVLVSDSYSTPVTATVYTTGWGSDNVFTIDIKGSWTTFIYETIKLNPEIPVNVNGSWKNSTPYVNVNGTWKEVTAVYVNVNGTWKKTS